MRQVQVSVENVTKKFGEVTAVDTLSLNVDRGEFLTLLGPSGCGKTTLLRIIAGFEEPTSGRVYIGNQDVTFIPPNKRPANMVFQRYALFPHLSVFENVAFGLRLKKLGDGEIHKRVERMLALSQLEGFGKRQVNQLSGGQAQRVALARALVNEPGVLLLDEPLGALDLKIRQQMEMELKLLHAQLGTTFIYVTHDQEEAMTIANRIVVMRQGRIIQDGTPEQIYANPSNSFVADFIGHSNLIPARVIQPEPTRLELLGGSFNVRNHPGLQTGQEVKVLLRPEVFVIFAQAPKDLENVIPSQVVDATFKGAYVDYLVDTGGSRLKVHYSIREGTQSFNRGDTIFLSWASDDGLVLTL
jgi:spermidine/putrescine transport system ATP-binding protein